MTVIEKMQEDINGVTGLVDKQRIARDYLLEQRKKLEDTHAKMEAEIEKAKNDIVKSYRGTFEEIDVDMKKIQYDVLAKYNELIKKLSIIDAELMGRAIEKLIEMVDNRSFKFQDVVLNTFYLEHSVWGGQCYEVSYEKYYFIVVDEECIKEQYDWPYDESSELDLLVEQSKAIVLGRHDYLDRFMRCYTLENGKVTSDIEVGKFDYVEKFIQFVVQYRFINNLEVFGEEEMTLALQEFVVQNKEEILKVRNSRFDGEVSNLVLRRNKIDRVKD